MPGILKIQTLPGCSANEVLMILSGSAEPNGGGHYATVDFTEQSQSINFIGIVNVEWEATPGNWVIVRVQSFLFTYLGETYKLRARGPSLLMNWPAIKFPYTVYGMYAPAWAAVDGIISGDPVDAECCASGADFYRHLVTIGMFSTTAPSQTCFSGWGCTELQCINDPTWEGLPDPTTIGTDINTDWAASLNLYPAPTKTAFYESAMSGVFNIPVIHDGGLYSTTGRISGSITKAANSWITTVSPTYHKGIGSGRFARTAVSGTTYSAPTILPVGGGCIAILLRGSVVSSTNGCINAYVSGSNEYSMSIGFRG